MELLTKIFEDKKPLLYLVKAGLLFGPGFLAIGYFKRELFIELDWFKLISLSALFGVIFLLPLWIVMWAIENLSPYRMQRRIAATTRELRGISTEVEDLSIKAQTQSDEAVKSGDAEAIRLAQGNAQSLQNLNPETKT